MPKAPSFKDLRIFTTNLAAFQAKGRHLWAKSQVKEPVSAIVVRFNAVQKYKRPEYFDCKEQQPEKQLPKRLYNVNRKLQIPEVGLNAMHAGFQVLNAGK